MGARNAEDGWSVIFIEEKWAVSRRPIMEKRADGAPALDQGRAGEPGKG